MIKPSRSFVTGEPYGLGFSEMLKKRRRREAIMGAIGWAIIGFVVTVVLYACIVITFGWRP